MAPEKRALLSRTSSTEGIGSASSLPEGAGSGEPKRPRTADPAASAEGREASTAAGGGAPVAAASGNTGFWFQELRHDEGSSCPVAVARNVAEHLVHNGNMQLFTQSTGATVEWGLGDKDVMLYGSEEQLNAGKRVLQRISTHCFWGVTEEKVRRLLSQKQIETIYVRLSPMGVALKPVEKELSSKSPMLTMGKEKENDAVIVDDLVSRQHCILELDGTKGAVYVLDLSTNGTFLNGKRLPQKKQGKIMVSHGDELLLKDPTQEAEFGYVVNLVVVESSVRSGCEGEENGESASRDDAEGRRRSLSSGK